MEWPNPDAARDLIRQYASLRSDFADDFGDRQLVLPTASFFPDAFARDQSGANRLVRRMKAHAGMDDIPIKVELTGLPQTPTSQACGGGACSSAPTPTRPMSLRDNAESWTLEIQAEVLGQPVLSTTLIAKYLATIFVEETRRANWQAPAQGETLAELVAVQLGFGVLLLEGAYVYTKSCGGPNVNQFTALSPGAIGLSVALFGQHTDLSAIKRAKKVVGATQASLLQQAYDWTTGNSEIGEHLRSTPAFLSDSHFPIGQPKRHPLAFLGFGGAKPRRGVPEPHANELLVEKNGPSRLRPDDELKSMVAAALAEQQQPR